MPRVMALTLLLPVAAMAADTIQPGRYETTVSTEMKMGSMQMPARSSQQSSCITEEQVANGPPLPDPENADCEVVEYEFADGELAMEMVCRMEGGEGRMVGTGTYTSDSYEMNNQFKMEVQGMVMEMNSIAKGQRVGDC